MPPLFGLQTAFGFGLHPEWRENEVRATIDKMDTKKNGITVLTVLTVSCSNGQ